MKASIIAVLTLAAAFMIPLSPQSEEASVPETPAPGSYEITSKDGVIRFPFEIYGGDIRYACKVNGHEVKMLLDDGFMWDPLLFWGSPLVDSLGLHYSGETVLGDDTDEAKQLVSRTASDITLSFPGVTFTDQTAVVTPSSSNNATMWAGSVGQASATFFKHFVVDINFDDMMITLIEPDRFEYTGGGVAVPWEPMGFGPWKIPAKIELMDGRKIALDFMMDLGYNWQLRLAMGGEHHITAPEGAEPASLGFNIQRVETRGYTGYIPHISIGRYTLDSVKVDFVLEEQRDHTYAEAMVGLGLLSRFNLVFDYGHRRLYIEPNKHFSDPF